MPESANLTNWSDGPVGAEIFVGRVGRFVLTHGSNSNHVLHESSWHKTCLCFAKTVWSQSEAHVRCHYGNTGNLPHCLGCSCATIRNRHGYVPPCDCRGRAVSVRVCPSAVRVADHRYAARFPGSWR